MALAFALVATATFASGDSDDGAAMAAEKEYVTDPSTGKQVLKPAYGGTITAAQLNFPFDHADTWVSHAGGVIGGAALDKLGQADWAVDRSVNKLVTYYPESVVTGHLAESWENPDPLTYIYKLRDNVFFHDKPPVNGRQLTADDMAANYERLFAIGRFAGQEPAVHTWGTKGLPFESVTATDELTLQIKLSRPNADTHRQLFDDCHVRAYPPETFDMLGNVNNLIGTGPFIVNEYVSGSSVTFDRNPDYWKDDEKYPGNRLPVRRQARDADDERRGDQACGTAVGPDRYHRGDGRLADQVDRKRSPAPGRCCGHTAVPDRAPIRDVVVDENG